MFVKAVSIAFLFLVRVHFPRPLSTIKVLQKSYGDAIVKKVREFEKFGFKYRKVLFDIGFLEACLKSKIMPKFPQFRVFKKDLRDSTTYKHGQIKLNKRYPTRKEN